MAKNLLITGAGSLAKEMIEQYRSDYDSIVVVARGEEKIFKLPNHVTGEICDVRDFDRVDEIMRRYNITECIHTAALKVLTMIENFPMECVRTNILGSENVARAADKNGLDKCVLVATDKACHPHPGQSYGASKLIARSIFTNYAKFSDTKFCSVLYGNVLQSRNSFIPIWLDLIRKGEPIKITHKDCARFFWTLTESAEFIKEVLDYTVGGETYVPLMDSYKITDIAEALGVIENKPVKKEFTKLHGAEKIHEEMNSYLEMDRTYYVTDKIVAIKPHYDLGIDYTYLTKKYDGPVINTENYLCEDQDKLIDLLKRSM